MRTQVIAIGVTLLCALSSRAAAETPAAAIILLPIEGEGLVPSLMEEVTGAMARMGKQVQLSSLKLDDLMLAVGCTDTSVACLQKIGENIQAQSLILATVRQGQGSAFDLTLRWFEVKTGGDSGRAQQRLPADAEERATAVLESVKALLGIRGPGGAGPGRQEAMGGLGISASVPYVEVVLDGQARGALPLEIRSLKVGKVEVLARRDGYVTWQGTAEVKADQMTRLEIEMVPLPQGAAAPTFLDAVRPQTWVVAGVGLTSLVVGSVFAAHMASQQNHMDDEEGVTLAEIARMKDYKETGDRDALAANICFGIGGGVLATAVILSYFDYRRGRASRESRSARLDVGPGSVRLDLSF